MSARCRARKALVSVLLLVLVPGLAVVAGCNLERAEQTTRSEFRLDTASGGRTKLTIRLERGSVEIEGSETDRVELTVTKRARSVDPEAARAMMDRIDLETRQEGDRISILDRSTSLAGSGFGIEVRADLLLRVPRDADLDVRTGAGSIRIERVDGTIVADTEDGRIRLESTGTGATLRSGDGSIVVRGLEGALDAQTGDGSIEIAGRPTRLRAVTSDGSIHVDCREGTTPAGRWLVQTADGSIELTLPASAAAELDATTTSGSIENRLSTFRGEEHDRRLSGRVGNGGPLILLSTMDGRIELRQQP